MPARNQLDKETSPYLLQHTDNPVHWLAWNADSLALARKLDRPILLSIGYSACHWCHVMAHESFEDDDTAAIMNALFVNIKVDKEERPDLDKIYQGAHSLLTQRPGGWPLTVFLTPDEHMPIFAGTYFPDKPRHGLPAFSELCQQIAQIWQQRKADIEQQSRALRETYDNIHLSTRPAGDAIDYQPLDVARNQLEQDFDRQHGGFSAAPKFPHPAILEFALKQWRNTDRKGGDDDSLKHCILHTLVKMSEGGLFDHLGGGFYRYSTDEQWMIPHFEKMLYDNGPLLSLYAQASTLQADHAFIDALNKTAGWVMREMQAEDGGYYSSQDADSEGEEGRFFCWNQDEIDSLLEQARSQAVDETIIKLFRQRFGLDRQANFEGKWHLHAYHTRRQLAEQHGLAIDELDNRMKPLLAMFLQARERRIHPQTDTKTLVSWNGLMIQGMAKAARTCQNHDYTVSALSAARFIKQHCWSKNGLSAIYKDGTVQPLAYLDDYAFLIYGLLELLQNHWDNELYQWALELCEQMLTRFEDREFGGFYFTAHEHEQLIQRIKPLSDDAIPSGNAIACLCLQRLGHLCAKPDWLESARRTIESAWSAIRHAPLSHSAMLLAVSELLEPPLILVIREQTADSQAWQDALSRFCLDDILVFRIAAGTTPPAELADKRPGSEGNTIAYPCRGSQCFKALESSEELTLYLQNNSYREME